MAMDNDNDNLRASINWNTHTILANPSYKTIPATTAVMPFNLASNACIILLAEKPFYIDSDTTMHIFLCASDFILLCLIPPQLVKGVGGTSIQAVSIGQISLQVQNQTEIYLENTLYILNSTVQVILISVLAIGMQAVITFSQTGVTILDGNSSTLFAAGPLIPGWCLYTLELQDALTEHAPTTTQPPVRLDTWHWHLGHAN